MPALTWPDWLDPASCEMGLQRVVIQHRSGITGTTQSVDQGVEYWSMVVTTPPRSKVTAGRDEAFFNQLVGGAQSVAMWHFGREVPRGTMRGSPTVNAAAAQFAKSIVLNAAGTLLAGDMIGVNGQLLQVSTDCAPSAGVMTVPLVNRLRSAVSAGAAVTWFRPTANFVMADMASAFVYGGGGSMAGSQFKFTEAL